MHSHINSMMEVIMKLRKSTRIVLNDRNIDINKILVRCESMAAADRLMNAYIYSIKDDPQLDRVLRRYREVYFKDGRSVRFCNLDKKHLLGFNGRVTNDSIFELENGLKC